MTISEIVFAILTSVGIAAYTAATIVIARYTKRNVELAEEIKKASEAERERNEEFREQVKDSYEAIVVATMIAAKGDYTSLGGSLSSFKEHYNGKTPFF